MEIIRGLHNIRPRHRGCVVTLGNFDGVHHGHQMVLSHLNAKRDELRAASTLITFEPLPREFFRASTMPARLTRFREKVILLNRTGIDRMLLLPFNERLAQVPARAVIEDFLVAQLNVRYVVVGDDFRFGHDREGDYAMLKAGGDRFGFDVSHIGTLTFDHARVSSSRIREALGRGELALAEKLLGHDLFIVGRVIEGRRLGRTLGTATANIALHRHRAPVEGVYAVEIDGLERRYRGVANVGVRPTVDGRTPVLEVHIFDFDRDIYGARLTITFRKKIRDEQRFPSLDALKAQIARDVVDTRRHFAETV